MRLRCDHDRSAGKLRAMVILCDIGIFGNLPVSCSAVSMCIDVHMYIGSVDIYVYI